MRRTMAGELAGRVGQDVHLCGWVHHQRHLSKVTFLLLRDRTGIAQVVITDDAAREQAASLAAEAIVDVVGTAAANEQAPGGVEVVGPSISTLVDPTAEPLPFELRRPDLDAQLPTLLDHAAIALRHPRRRAVAQVAAASAAGFRATLDAMGFTEVFTPKVVATATESGASVFGIDWFGQPAYLAQSPQLYKQVMVGALERVYEVAPVFRAEPHDTVRHLAEYVSLDVELGFIEDHHDVMAVLGDVLAGMVDAVARRAADAVGLLGLSLPTVAAPIPTLGFREAQALVEAGTGRPTVGEPDLAPADERWLGDWAEREHGSSFLFVTGYPMAKRPFYTHPAPADPEASNSFDLLFAGTELVTGGQRLHRHADYLRALAGQDLAPYAGYLEAFAHGMPPHGGFAIGLERWVARLTGAANVREVTLFPRDRRRVTP